MRREYTQEEGGLPKEYQQVEYIESTGTQYLDLNFASTDVYSLHAEYKLSCTKNDGTILSFTNRDVNPPEGFSISNWKDGRAGAYAFTGYASQISSFNVGYSAPWNIIMDYDGTMCSATLNGTTHTYRHGTGGRRTVPMFYLFGAYDSYYGSIQYGAFKLYYFQLTCNGTLIRDMVPCYRKSDGEIGMYDLVNKVFYTNQGSGTFLKGADV